MCLLSAACPSAATPQRTFRTEMQCRGERASGEVFLADVFFSTYQTAMGPRLAALVVDASEQLREREESGLEQLLAGSRILVGAVSHEIRNVCGAIAVIYENLARSGALQADRDFEALGSLVETLTRIASVELKQSQRPARWPASTCSKPWMSCASSLSPIAGKRGSTYAGACRKNCRRCGPTVTACCRCSESH